MAEKRIVMKGSSQTIKMPTDTRELVAAKKIHAGMNPARAVAEAGYNFPTKEAAQNFGERIKEKFNSRIIAAYESIGLTPEYLAEKHKEMLDSDEVRPGDKLKAIDQILNVVGGYAPKQLDVTTVSFEQAVIEISSKVDLSQLRTSDIRKMLAEEKVEDAELVE